MFFFFLIHIPAFALKTSKLLCNWHKLTKIIMQLAKKPKIIM